MARCSPIQTERIDCKAPAATRLSAVTIEPAGYIGIDIVKQLTSHRLAQ